LKHWSDSPLKKTIEKGRAKQNNKYTHEKYLFNSELFFTGILLSGTVNQCGEVNRSPQEQRYAAHA
jgi:hypothetical protein